MAELSKKKPMIPIEEWEPSKNEIEFDEKIVRPSYSYIEESWLALKKNKLAMLSLFVVILVSLIAVVGPMFSPYNYDEQNLDFTSIPPTLETYALSENQNLYVTKDLRIYSIRTDGYLIESLEVVEQNFVKRYKSFEFGETLIKIDFSEKPTRILDANGNEVKSIGKIRNKRYILGTDKLGRDMLVRLMYGARISLTVALIATFVNVIIGVLYGGIAGYFGGWVDNLMIRAIDIISAVPMMLYIILLMVVLGPGLKTIIIAMGVVFWIGTARLVRGEVLRLKSQEYVMAAKVIGVSDFKIIVRHLLPNAIGPIMVSVTFMIPDAIFTEAFLSFIGLGIPAPQASWGTLCEAALEGLQTYPYQLFLPALAISITILSFNLLGDGLRDALDPRLRQ